MSKNSIYQLDASAFQVNSYIGFLKKAMKRSRGKFEENVNKNYGVLLFLCTQKVVMI